MPSIHAMILVALAGLALSASPGPSMLYVLSRSVGQSRAAGLASAAGLAVGGCVHVLAAALGLVALFTYWPSLFVILKFVGALYLIFLGIDMLRDGASPGIGDQPKPVPRQSLRWIFVQGILVEVLNPKTLLFFVAFVPQFVAFERGSIVLQMLVLGALVPLTAVPSDLIVAFTGGNIAARLASNQTMSRSLAWLGAAILCGLGVKIIISA